ncbi:MAG TPA: hypothetical protein ENJ19_01900 [Gammaproteobacteria bacterium]|nr:hypothetical protein [Gammaproteobacteria bacterium]
MPVTLSSGLFTGIDTQGIIQQLLAVERQPLQALTVKKADFEAKISSYGSIKSALSSLKDVVKTLTTDQLQNKTASSSDSSKLTVSADSSAANGSYEIEIDTLATAQSIYSGTFAFQTSEVADLSVVSSQKIKIQLGNGTAKEITVDSSNNTLTGVKDAINAAAAGVNASIINAGFDVTASNNQIVFNDGSQRTATLTAGSYTPDEMAAEIKRALEAANGGTDTYTVSYDTASATFTVLNDATNTNAVDLLWEDAGSTAAALLGYSTTDHSPIAVGASQSSDSAVGGFRLVLNADNTGAANRIKLLVDEDNDGIYEESGETDTSGLSRLAFNPSYDASGNVSGGVANFTQSKAAVSAALKVNGLSVSRASNTVSDVITGVTLNLLDTTSGSKITVSVADDDDSITSALNNFASSYNSAFSLVKSLSAVGSDGAAIFTGDATARTIQDTLRNTITTRFGDYTPARLGFSHSRTGDLSLDSSIFASALAADRDGVLASVNAMSSALEDDLSFLINEAVPGRTEGLNSSIERMDEDIADLERRLVLKEEQLVKTFSLLEETVGQLQSNGDFLTQQLQGISNISGNGN